MFETILNKITAILDANTLIDIVYNYEAEQYTGDPVAVVIPSANESDYNTLEENVRVYAFTVRIFVTRVKPRKEEDADRIMREVVSSVIDDFDKYYSFATTGTDGSSIPGGAISNPTGYTFINVFAAPSAWGYSGRESEYRVAEINLSCRVSVDLSSIS